MSSLVDRMKAVVAISQLSCIIENGSNASSDTFPIAALLSRLASPRPKMAPFFALNPSCRSVRKKNKKTRKRDWKRPPPCHPLADEVLPAARQFSKMFLLMKHHCLLSVSLQYSLVRHHLKKVKLLNCLYTLKSALKDTLASNDRLKNKYLTFLKLTRQDY